jgi:hypothetical protein
MTSSEAEERRTRTLRAAFGFAVAALALLALLVVLGLKRMNSGDVVESPGPAAASKANAQETAERRSSAIAAKEPDGRLFAPASFWNERLVPDAPLDPNTDVLVQALVAEVQRERAAAIGPWIGTGAGSTPVYRVPADQPRVRIRLDSRNNRGSAALQRALNSVPMPRQARPAPGLDRHLTIWQPSTDRLWDLYGARRANDGWHTRWGGAIRHVSQSPGYYTASAWPGATRNWGATASSLPVIGGTMLVDELRRGRITHALALNLPAPRAGVFSWPAQRTDGTGPASALPEGARVRLDPTVNVADLHLPKFGRMIARAAQRYGMVVRDQTHHGMSLFAEVPTSPSDLRAYHKLFNGKTPGDILANFPWDHLQVLQMHLCTRAPCRYQ